MGAMHPALPYQGARDPYAVGPIAEPGFQPRCERHPFPGLKVPLIGHGLVMACGPPGRRPVGTPAVETPMRCCPTAVALTAANTTTDRNNIGHLPVTQETRLICERWWPAPIASRHAAVSHFINDASQGWWRYD